MCKINGLNGSAALMQEGLSGRKGDLGKVGAGGSRCEPSAVCTFRATASGQDYGTLVMRG